LCTARRLLRVGSVVACAQRKSGDFHVLPFLTGQHSIVTPFCASIIAR
jgi:hypothetical protein